MTPELAFLLGAYASEGHTTRVNWTVTITNACEGVLARVAAAWGSEFGVAARITRDAGRCAGVAVSSKTIVEFLEYLGTGSRARVEGDLPSLWPSAKTGCSGEPFEAADLATRHWRSKVRLGAGRAQ